MKAAIIASLLVFSSCSIAATTETDFEKADRIISRADKPKMLKELLTELGLVKPWTERGDSRILLDMESSLGGIGRNYRAIGFPNLKKIFFAGRLPDSDSTDYVNFQVTKIVVSSITHYYVYYWIDGKYKRSIMKEITRKQVK